MRRETLATTTRLYNKDGDIPLPSLPGQVVGNISIQTVYHLNTLLLLGNCLVLKLYESIAHTRVKERERVDSSHLTEGF